MIRRLKRAAKRRRKPVRLVRWKDARSAKIVRTSINRRCRERWETTGKSIGRLFVLDRRGRFR